VWSFPKNIAVPMSWTDGYLETVGGGNSFLTIPLFTQEALEILKKNLVFENYCVKDFERSRRVGSTLTVRRPVRYDR
jgi:hypothetical protein